MFEYVLNLIYNLPKTEASVVYSEMTDRPNEIRLGNKSSFCLSFNVFVPIEILLYREWYC